MSVLNATAKRDDVVVVVTGNDIRRSTALSKYTRDILYVDFMAFKVVCG